NRCAQLVGPGNSFIDIKYNILPDNGWSILAIFSNTKRAFSVKDLQKLFGEGMHLNTIRALIAKLLKRSFIKIHRENCGKTHSQKTFKITLDGLATWEIYKERQAQC
ncbi:hypothetical protein DRO91_10705, partial [Candidatus Heimdallarchaeota archaeon]